MRKGLKQLSISDRNRFGLMFSIIAIEKFSKETPLREEIMRKLQESGRYDMAINLGWFRVCGNTHHKQKEFAKSLGYTLDKFDYIEVEKDALKDFNQLC